MNTSDGSATSGGRCPGCGGAFAVDGWCARCALGEILSEESANATELDSKVLFKVPGHAVLAELGRGAAGIVYRARQEHPAREVALKILRPHEAGSAESRARFRMEATTVAGLDHPAILPVLSVGEHDGLPYFTMKLCAGGSLAQRVEQYHGKWKEIAGLVATLSDAVHHAHQRGVLHRDLKPGNILFDEAERPFVSDFGIAKNFRDTESGAPVTQSMAVMGTRGYLAPEVLSKGAGAATLAADVYGLGAILFELLTGTKPRDNFAVTSSRGVPRDLAVIATKCLQPEPAARYASAAALAEDLRAWLAGRPIAARPVSALGQAWAWAKRNPALGGVSAAALLALLAVAGVASVAAMRLNVEQHATAAALKKAETEAAISKSIADFLQDDLLLQASPELQPDRNLSLRTVLDRAAKKIDNRFPNQPLVEASIRNTLSKTYGSLGDYSTSQRQAQRTFEIYQRQLGPESPETLRAQSRLALALFRQGEIAAADAAVTSTLAILTKTTGLENYEALYAMTTKGVILQKQGKRTEMLELVTKTLEISKRVLGPDHPLSVNAMNTLATGLAELGRQAEAESLYVQVVEIGKRTVGIENPATIGAMYNLGTQRRAMGKTKDAELIFKEALEISKRVLGPEHPTTMTVMALLAQCEDDAGEFDEAERLSLQAVELRKRILGPEHASTLLSMTNLATLDRNRGRFAEADVLNRQIWEIRKRVLGPENFQTLISMGGQALIYRAWGKLAEAEALTLQLLEIRKRMLGPDHPDTLNSMNNLADNYFDQGRWDEAKPLYLKTVEWRKKILGPDHRQTLWSSDSLGRTLLQLREFTEAERILRSCLADHIRNDAEDWRTHSARSALGGALVGLKRFAEAEPFLLDGYSGLKSSLSRIPAPDNASALPVAGGRLVELYRAWEKPAEADAWRQKISTGADSR